MALNALQRYLLDTGRSEVETMDLLQLESRVVSDCAVWAADVSESDARAAVEWLKVQAAKDVARTLKF
jgi:hypothetical protein